MNDEINEDELEIDPELLEGIEEPPANDLDALCDAFDYDPSEFKKNVKHSNKLSRYEEDAINTVFENLPSNKINQLGLGPKILELKRRGFSLQAIAERFDIPQGQVRQWWDTFQSMTPKQKNVFAKVMNENSVFNITQQLEEAFKNLNDMARDVKENPELWVIYHGQIINTLKFAKDVTQAMNLEQKREKEVDIILEEIRKMDPKAAMAIVKKLQEYRSTRDMLGG